MSNMADMSIYTLCDLFDRINFKKSFVYGYLLKADIVGQMPCGRCWVKRIAKNRGCRVTVQGIFGNFLYGPLFPIAINENLISLVRYKPFWPLHSARRGRYRVAKIQAKELPDIRPSWIPAQYSKPNFGLIKCLPKTGRLSRQMILTRLLVDFHKAVLPFTSTKSYCRHRRPKSLARSAAWIQHSRPVHWTGQIQSNLISSRKMCLDFTRLNWSQFSIFGWVDLCVLQHLPSVLGRCGQQDIHNAKKSSCWNRNN